MKFGFVMYATYSFDKAKSRTEKSHSIAPPRSKSETEQQIDRDCSTHHEVFRSKYTKNIEAESGPFSVSLLTVDL